MYTNLQRASTGDDAHHLTQVWEFPNVGQPPWIVAITVVCERYRGYARDGGLRVSCGRSRDSIDGERRQRQQRTKSTTPSIGSDKYRWILLRRLESGRANTQRQERVSTLVRIRW